MEMNAENQELNIENQESFASADDQTSMRMSIDAPADAAAADQQDSNNSNSNDGNDRTRLISAASDEIISFAADEDGDDDPMLEDDDCGHSSLSLGDQQPQQQQPIIYSWGRVDLGSLFRSTSSDQVDGFHAFDSVATSRTFLSVASNVYHSAAVTTTGELYTCGFNSDGQVTTDADVTAAAAAAEDTDHSTADGDQQLHIHRPRMLESLSQQRVVSVSCGLSHTVAVTASGCAMSFGGNDCGQLGHSSGMHSHVRPRVVNFADLSSISSSSSGVAGRAIIIKKAVCGDLFTLLLTTAGTVYGCGSAAYLGNPNIPPNDNSSSSSGFVCPAQRVETLLASQIVDLAAGAQHALALSRAGDLYSWGSNRHCALGYHHCSDTTTTAGDGVTTDVIVDPLTASFHQQLPRKVPLPLHPTDDSSNSISNSSDSNNNNNNSSSSGDDVRVVGLSAGAAHSVIWTNSGLLLGAGSNKFGQLALLVPVAESFTVIDLQQQSHLPQSTTDTAAAAAASSNATNAVAKCVMAACGSNHTLALTAGSCAAQNKLLAFGSNSNGQVSGASTATLFRAPVEVFPQQLQQRFQRSAAAAVDCVLLVAAGGDHSFAIGARNNNSRSNGHVTTATNYYGTSTIPQQQQQQKLTAGAADTAASVVSFGGGLLLKKQFSSAASRALESMSARALHNLLLKAKAATATTASDSSNSGSGGGNTASAGVALSAADSSAVQTAALATVSELFASPSLLAGSFCVDPATADAVVFSGGDTKAILSADATTETTTAAAAAASTDAAAVVYEQLSSSMIFDTEGVEQCYTALMSLGTSAVARLFAALQQSVTELEHAANINNSNINNSKGSGPFAGWKFGLSRSGASTAAATDASAAAAATLLPDSCYRVFLLMWQSPIMGNPSMSAELLTRLLRLVDGQQRCHLQQQQQQQQLELSTTGATTSNNNSSSNWNNKLIAMFLQYPDHLLASRILQPLQQHLAYHIRAAEGSNSSVLSSADSSTVNPSVKLICRALRWLHAAYSVRRFVSTADQFNNDGISALPDTVLLFDYRLWLKDCTERAKLRLQSSKKRKMKSPVADQTSSANAATAADSNSSSSGGESSSNSSNVGGATIDSSAAAATKSSPVAAVDTSVDAEAVEALLQQEVAAAASALNDDDDFDYQLPPGAAFKANTNNSSPSATAASATTTNRGSSSRQRRPFCLSAYPYLLSADVKRRILHAVSFEQQRSAQSQAFFGGISSGLGMFQPFFVLPIERTHLLQQALIHLSSASDLDLKKPMKVVFIGEEGVDEGGVRKEFFQLLMQQLLAQEYAMFQTAPSGRVLWINRSNNWSSDEYALVGTLLALAVYNDVLLDVHLPSVFYKKLLLHRPENNSNSGIADSDASSSSSQVVLSDLLSVDPELHRGLQQLLSYEPASQVEDVFCRSFVVEWEEFGAKNEVELIPNGKSVAVTGSNRAQYVQLLVRWLLHDSVALQFSALAAGFRRVVDRQAMLLFTAEELELVMTGTPHLDFKELQQHTQYIGPDDWSADNSTVQAFWSVLHSLSLQQKQRFLLFVSGSMKAPIGGLKNIGLKIQRMGPHSMSLPTAHTCFNTLLLPEYSSEEHLRNRLVTAINECSGFGLK